MTANNAPVAHKDTCLPAGREQQFPNMYYVYALKGEKHNRIYVGLTKDLNARLIEHNNGKTKSTKFYKPWSLIYSEEHDSRIVAREREKKLKSGFGKEYLKSLLTAPVAHKDRAAVS